MANLRANHRRARPEGEREDLRDRAEGEREDLRDRAEGEAGGESARASRRAPAPR
jgi:hypothetical protein